jgi:hypothetical protein
MMLPRRAVLLAGALLAGSSWFQASTPAMMTTTMTSDDWADWICAYTPPSFRHAVQASNHFLYRGAEQTTMAFCNTPCTRFARRGNLRRPRGTRVFRMFGTTTRPSIGSGSAIEEWSRRGHVGSQRGGSMGAGRFGMALLGTKWSYVWPRDQTTLFVLDSGNTYTCQEDRLVFDANLPNALTQPREKSCLRVGFRKMRARCLQPFRNPGRRRF